MAVSIVDVIKTNNFRHESFAKSKYLSANENMLSRLIFYVLQLFIPVVADRVLAVADLHPVLHAKLPQSCANP